jgi:hypothetical protein
MGIRDYPAYWINAKVPVETLATNTAYCDALAAILQDRGLLDTVPSFFYCKKIHNPTSFEPDLYDAAARAARLLALRSHVYSACGKKWVPPPPVEEKKADPAVPNATQTPFDIVNTPKKRQLAEEDQTDESVFKAPHIEESELAT